MLEGIKATFPNRSINCSAAEQVIVGSGVGLAQEGQIPFVFAITTVFLFRPFETTFNYAHHERALVLWSGLERDSIAPMMATLTGGGKTRVFENRWHRQAHWPTAVEVIPILVERMLPVAAPSYLNLRR